MLYKLFHFNQPGPGRPSLDFAALILFLFKYFETKSRTSSFDGLKLILRNTPLLISDLFTYRIDMINQFRFHIF